MRLDGRWGEKDKVIHALLILLVVLGWAIRIIDLSPQILWSDEVYSATVANGSFLDVILAGLRYDIHPPLYYLQLHLWTLLGNSDEWLLTNSFFWAAMTNISIFVIVRRLAGFPRALLAAAAYAVLPIHVIFAEFLRMYTLVAFISVWIFYYIEIIARSADHPVKNNLILAMLFVLLGWVHGFGFFVGAFLLLYGLIRLLQTGLLTRYGAVLLLPVAGYVVGAAYALVVGYMRRTIGLDQFDIVQIGYGLAITIFGFGMPWPAFAGLLGVVLLVGLTILSRDSRTILLILFLLPLFAMLVVTLVKPVFTYRSAALFAIFLPLGFAWEGASPAESRENARATARQWLMVIILGMMTAITAHVPFLPEIDDYRVFSYGWDKESAPGDYVFSTSDYMGFVRYLPDAKPQGALDVQPPQGAQWDGVKRRLGVPMMRKLRLIDAPDHLDYSRQRRVYTWFDKDLAARLPVYWLFESDADLGCGIDGFKPSVVRRSHGHALIRCRKEAM